MKYITSIDLGNLFLTSFFPFIGFIGFLDSQKNSFVFNSLKGFTLGSFLNLLLIAGISFLYDFFSIKYTKFSITKLISKERKKNGFKEFKYNKENIYKNSENIINNNDHKNKNETKTNTYQLNKIFKNLLRYRDSFLNILSKNPEIIIGENKANTEIIERLDKLEEKNLSNNKLILNENKVNKIFKKSCTANYKIDFNSKSNYSCANNNELISVDKFSNIYTENEKFLFEKDDKINYKTEIIKKKSIIMNRNIYSINLTSRKYNENVNELKKI